jgi:hypothetical protein
MIKKPINFTKKRKFLKISRVNKENLKQLQIRTYLIDLILNLYIMQLINKIPINK